MGEAAVAAARAVDYRNAGTVEFLLEGSGDAARFYFLEMNTRLQVEHPVTEAVAGVDLVRAQLASRPASRCRGRRRRCHSAATRSSAASTPRIPRTASCRRPDGSCSTASRPGPGIRVDSGVVEGGEVPVTYDPLLAKLIVQAETRDAAIERAIAALRRYPVLGIRTNIPFLLRVLDHPAFRAGDVHTGFIDEHLEDADRAAGATPAAVAAAAARRPAPARPRRRAREHRAEARRFDDPWTTLQGWGR